MLIILFFKLFSSLRVHIIMLSVWAINGALGDSNGTHTLPWQPLEKVQQIGRAMAANSLNRYGLYFDELNKIRIWDPEAANKTQDLNELCRDFVQKTSEFHDTAKGLITTAEELSQLVDREKMKALGSSNTLMSMAKSRESQKQQYQALILEKATELDRLRVQHQALLKTEAEQQELLDQLLQL